MGLTPSEGLPEASFGDRAPLCSGPGGHQSRHPPAPFSQGETWGNPFLGQWSDGRRGVPQGP